MSLGRCLSRFREPRWPLRSRAAVLALVGLCACGGLLAPERSGAVQLNLSTLSCGTYENEVLTRTMPGYTVDSIDTVMWLFGYSIAKNGERFMYGDSLSPFGYALDGVCKNNPDETVLDAVMSVKSSRKNPMDLTRLDCATFAPRHVALRKSDPESATTLTMWMFGYAVGLSDDRVYDSEGEQKFESDLEAHCAKYPEDSLFDALHAITSKAPHPKVMRKRPKPAPQSPTTAPAMPPAPDSPPSPG